MCVLGTLEFMPVVLLVRPSYDGVVASECVACSIGSDVERRITEEKV